MALFNYGAAETSLVGDISDTDTEFGVEDASVFEGWRPPFPALLGDPPEIVTVSKIDNNRVTVTRASFTEAWAPRAAAHVAGSHFGLLLRPGLVPPPTVTETAPDIEVTEAPLVGSNPEPVEETVADEPVAAEPEPVAETAAEPEAESEPVAAEEPAAETTTESEPS